MFSRIQYFLSFTISNIRTIPAFSRKTTGQLFFLVLFSYSFFIKGINGLTVAIGSVVTLAILMRVTATLDWNNRNQILQMARFTNIAH